MPRPGRGRWLLAVPCPTHPPTHVHLYPEFQARRRQLPFDVMVFDEIMVPEEAEQITCPARCGAYVRGLFFEGGAWNKETEVLDERPPRVLFSRAPVILLQPKRQEEIPPRPHYKCPTYRVSTRAGVLSTTGHSTSFVFFVRVPIQEGNLYRTERAHWTERGCALLTQLDGEE